MPETFVNVSPFPETFATISLVVIMGSEGNARLPTQIVGYLKLWHQPNCSVSAHIESSNYQRLSRNMHTHEASCVTTKF